MNAFAGRAVAVKSYSSDTEGLILATQIVDALTKSGIRVEDNRLTMQPAGSVSFGVSVDGTDKTLVEQLRKAFALDADLTKGSSVFAMNRGGISVSVEFGRIQDSHPRQPLSLGLSQLNRYKIIAPHIISIFPVGLLRTGDAIDGRR